MNGNSVSDSDDRSNLKCCIQFAYIFVCEKGANGTEDPLKERKCLGGARPFVIREVTAFPLPPFESIIRASVSLIY